MVVAPMWERSSRLKYVQHAGVGAAMISAPDDRECLKRFSRVVETSRTATGDGRIRQ